VDARAGAQVSADDPDTWYARRDQADAAQRAAAIWQRRAEANPQDLESVWKLSRACYWLGGHAAEAARRGWLEKGVTAGQQAAQIRPDRPEGYFWMAANMGELAESFGLRAGLKYRGRIRSALEKVLAIDPAFQEGSADRALGRWYFKVPVLFGGSKAESEAHLRKSLSYDPASTATLYFLAETLFARDKDAEAVAALRKVLDVPFDPEWGPEDREFKAKARGLLAQHGG